MPDEINAGNIRAVLNLGGNLVTAFPDAEAKLIPALEKLEVFATSRDHRKRDDRPLDPRPADERSARARRCDVVGHHVYRGVTSQHTEAVVEARG